MADEMEEMQELTDEEIFEQHRAEIDEMFEEKNFFRRVADMFAGLKQPKSSREYKIARTELQRLAAPLVAILLPVVGVIVLIVMTAVSGQVEEHVTVDIAQITQEETKLEDEDPPEEEIDMTQDIDATVDVSTDVPTPEMANPAPPSPDPGGEPDKVSAAPSPVTMSAVSGTVKMRGLGDGTAGGFGTLIGNGGKAQNTEGCLIGVIMALNRDASGKTDPSYNQTMYKAAIGDLTKADFSVAARAKYYSPNKRVATTKINIPEQDRKNGPKAFGVEKDIEPKFWVIYYTGTLKPAQKARYRFVGYFDEAMVIKLDGKVVYESYWGTGPQVGKNDPGVYTGWKPSDTSVTGKWQSPQGNSKLVVGDWFNAEPGKPIKMDLLIGEFGGGKVGGLLLIQQEGVEYPSKGGHPVLPIFASRPLSVKEKELISQDPYGIGVDSPKMYGRAGAKAAADKMKKDDVSVQVDI